MSLGNSGANTGQQQTPTVVLSKKLISRNVIINVVGYTVPMLFAVVTMPFVIRSLGNDRFGLLSIAWLFLGYFSILDLGMGRATTKFVVEFIDQGLVKETLSLIWTSILSLFLLGAMLGAMLLIATPYLVTGVLNIPAGLTEEAVHSFYWIALSIPFVIGLASARGVLEAQQKFALINIIRIPSSILNYVIPAITALYTSDLVVTIAWLTITRALLLFLHIFFCLQPFKHVHASKFDLPIVAKLLKFGGWLTVSNIIGPVMLYFDRFFIASLLTMTLVAYYTTPYEVITKFTVLAGAATGVLFPAFASLALSNKKGFDDLYHLACKGIAAALFPVCLLFAIFSSEFLTVWLNEQFARESAVVLQLLCLGVLLNSLASIAFTAVQALNRPDLSAKVHLMELPIYMALLFFMTSQFGINGVALAWMLRNLADAIIFMIVYQRLSKLKTPGTVGTTVLLFLTLFSSFVLSFFMADRFDWPIKLGLFMLLNSLFFMIFWFKILNASERSMIFGFLKK